MPILSQNLSTFNTLAGPAMSVSSVTALGGVYAKYENNFVAEANDKWATNGSDTNIASASSAITPNYYDRAEIYYSWHERTGDQMWLDRANAIALDYRRDYIDPNNYEHLRVAHKAHEMQVAGLALHYLATGEEASRVAVGKIADTYSASYYMNAIGNIANSEIDARVQAKVLEGLLYAKLINAPSTGISGASHIPGGNNWDTLLHTALDRILSTQSAAGDYNWSMQGGGAPWQNGMLNEALMDYYRLYDADPRIVTAVKKNVDYMWANNWDANAKAFWLNEGNHTAAADLNNMISSSFAWIYHMTSDATYKTRAETIFSAGVNGALLDGEKQFNQEYTSSYKTLYWLHNTAGNTAPALPSDLVPDAAPSSPSEPVSATINGTDGADTINGTSNADTINALGGNDTIYALDGNDTVYGGVGNDQLHGNAGDDVIVGGAARDLMWGQAGNDTFVFSTISESPANSNRDLIMDWNRGDDTMDLRAIDANTAAASDQAFVWHGSGAFSGKAGELRYFLNGDKTIVEGTVNADKVADFQIQINGQHTLAAADFLI